MSDRKPLYRYKRQVRISKKEPLEGCYAYCLDGHPDGRDSDSVSCNVGLDSCHCCDYFFVEEVVDKTGKKIKAISLVEIKNLSIEKQKLTKAWGDYFFGRKKKGSNPNKDATCYYKEATGLYEKAAKFYGEAANIHEEVANLHKKAAKLYKKAADLYEADFFRTMYLPWKCTMQIYGSMAVFGRLGSADENLRDCERYKLFLVIGGSMSKKAPKAMKPIEASYQRFLAKKAGSVLSDFLAKKDKNKAEVCYPESLKKAIESNAVLPNQSPCSRS